MNDTQDKYASDMSAAEAYVEAVVLCMIATVAISGNVSLWMVILSSRSLRRQPNLLLLLSLSLADLLVSVVSMPITAATIALSRWVFSERTCSVMGFLNMLSLVCSVMSLGLISINRYIKVCRSYCYNKVYTTRNIFFMTVGVWCLSALLSSPPLLGWSRYDYLPRQSFCFCDWSTSVSYTFFMVLACFFGPLSMMSGCGIAIWKKFRASQSRLRLPRAMSLSRHDAKGKTCQNKLNNLKDSKTELSSFTSSSSVSFGQRPSAIASPPTEHRLSTVASSLSGIPEQCLSILTSCPKAVSDSGLPTSTSSPSVVPKHSPATFTSSPKEDSLPTLTSSPKAVPRQSLPTLTSSPKAVPRQSLPTLTSSPKAAPRQSLPTFTSFPTEHSLPTLTSSPKAVPRQSLPTFTSTPTAVPRQSLPTFTSPPTKQRSSSSTLFSTKQTSSSSTPFSPRQMSSLSDSSPTPELLSVRRFSSDESLSEEDDSVSRLAWTPERPGEDRAKESECDPEHLSDDAVSSPSEEGTEDFEPPSSEPTTVTPLAVTNPLQQQRSSHTLGSRPCLYGLKSSIKTTRSVSLADMQHMKRERHRKQITQLVVPLLVVVVVFVTCWFPFCITMFFSVFAPQLLPRAADIFTLLLGYSNSCFNPIIYGMINKRVNQVYKTLWTRMCPCWYSRKEDESDSRVLGTPTQRSVDECARNG